MGAGQIGGIASLLDIDFDNAAGFIGTKADITDGNHVVYYLSHAMMFCVGAIIEAHVILTPASCVFAEKYKFEVYGGTHQFLEHAGVSRLVQHVCIHRGYNHTNRWSDCTTANIALLVLNEQFSFHIREHGTDFTINRVRYGTSEHKTETRIGDPSCRYYGWGSRRNGYLIPLLITIRRVQVNILPEHKCPSMWRKDGMYLCIQQPMCKSEKFGALCPDDMGSLIVCSGFAQGMMTSRLVDRPCGTGFLDLTKFNKFLTCGVDDSRDVIDHDEYMAFDFTTRSPQSTITLLTPPKMLDHSHSDVEKEVSKEEEKAEESKEKAKGKQETEEDEQDSDEEKTKK